MEKNILFTIIPKSYWIAFFFALLLIATNKEIVPIAVIICNLLLLLIGHKLAIFIHELGHLLFAKIVGGIPRRLILGRGHNVAHSYYKGVKVVLNSNFTSGFALATFNDPKYLRLKFISYISGGIIANFIVSGLLYFSFGFSINPLNNIELVSAIGLINLFIGVSALIPYYFTYQGIRFNSDGLSLLLIPFCKKPDLLKLSSLNDLFDALDLFESKKYEEAIEIYEDYQSRTEGSLGININLSLAYLKLGKYERSVELLEELLPTLENDLHSRQNNFIYNNLAWSYLLLNNLEKADKYSKIAYKVDPHSEFVRATRASVLVEKGEFEQSKNVLKKFVDFKFPNSHTLSSAIYLSLAFHGLNETKKAKKIPSICRGSS